MDASFEIELSDLTEDAVRRLLRSALRQQAINSMPVGKRGKAKKEMQTCQFCGDDSDDCDCMKDDIAENNAKVQMNGGSAAPKLPSVTTEDLPRGTRLPRQIRTGSRNRKNGQKS